MESYTDFTTRINSFEQVELGITTNNGLFKPSESVFEKVDSKNKFMNFYGDTVVFKLEEEYRDEISELIKFLYKKSSDCFAKMLPARTLHMTLHDLSNDKSHDRIRGDMIFNELLLRKLVSVHPVANESIRMRANYIINMVNTSLVLSLCPCDEEEYNKIMKLYNLVDNVMPLPYKFTPHITLAYFSRYEVDENQINNLKNVVRELNYGKWGGEYEIILNTSNLVYQFFDRMDSYIDLYNLRYNTL